MKKESRTEKPNPDFPPTCEHKNTSADEIKVLRVKVKGVFVSIQTDCICARCLKAFLEKNRCAKNRFCPDRVFQKSLSKKVQKKNLMFTCCVQTHPLITKDIGGLENWFILQIKNFKKNPVIEFALLFNLNAF